MCSSRYEGLLDLLLEHYRRDEMPALLAQMERFAQKRPFAGKKILDATPVFRNTLCKHLSLLCGGAELTAAFGGEIPYDENILPLLERYGVAVVKNGTSGGRFDVVLDCGGVNRQVQSNFGCVELTRSGAHRYRGSKSPVIIADSSSIKEIETALGTGYGFYAAMRQLGYGDFTGKTFVLFGCGKVGRGILHAIIDRGGKVAAADLKPVGALPPNASFLDASDRKKVRTAVENAWCVVSATGVKNAVARCCEGKVLRESSALLANMGLEDEFGGDVPAERVLNGKRPLNFILEEPTALRYIDPTMALHNFCAAMLLAGKSGPVDPAWEKIIFEDIRDRRGAAAEEIENYFRSREI